MITLHHAHQISLESVLLVSHGMKVTVTPETQALLAKRRREIEEFVTSQTIPAYGFNRGFGHNVDHAVSSEGLELLQKNLIRSHASGVGEHAPKEIVRATMFLRTQSLLRGNSGIRPAIIDQLIACLNNNITPVVPFFGSVGASGDLAPLSHIALALMGEGEVLYTGKIIPAFEALKNVGLKPLVLEMKEGLALNNGVQFSTAIGILATAQCRTLLKQAALATALSTQVMLGVDTPFAPELHELRPHPGGLKVAGWLHKLMADSPLRESHRAYDTDGEIQDPYSVRCAPQILGACEELMSDAEKTLTIEINSATDNPLILPDNNGRYTNIISGGHFHGMPVATRLYGVLEACGIMARLSNMRCVRYVDEARNKGLGSDLIWPKLSALEKSTSSGMMVPEYASAALTNFLWGELMPNHVFSLSTDAGQEDHVSMSAGLAVKLWKTLPHVARVLAIEFAFAAQGAAIRKELDGFPSKVRFSEEQSKKVGQLFKSAKKEIESLIGEEFRVEIQSRIIKKNPPADRMLNSLGEKVIAKIYETFPPVEHDRPLGAQLERLGELVFEGGLLEIPEVKQILN